MLYSIHYVNVASLSGVLPFVKVVDNFDAEYEVGSMKQRNTFHRITPETVICKICSVCNCAF